MSDQPTPAPLPARPVRDGVVASTVHLPPGPWPTVLDGLCALFPTVPSEHWRDRMARGLVLDAHGQPIGPLQRYRPGLCVRYFREVPAEPPIPFAEGIVHVDRHLIVVDKPPFLPVVPAGSHVGETLLARLIRRFDNPDLAPLHRIDRATRGLVMFSADPHTRARYQALFRDRHIDKRYEAIAAPLPTLQFPLTRATRLAAGEPFFRMQEIDGPANSETQVDVIARGPTHWRYALRPVTGRKHQLRVHMAALGAAILGEDLYPRLDPRPPGDYGRPLQLLAQGLSFADPIDGTPRRFVSRQALVDPA